MVCVWPRCAGQVMEYAGQVMPKRWQKGMAWSKVPAASVRLLVVLRNTG